MKLGFAHELGLAVALCASVAIVLFGGELPTFAWLVLLAPWVGAVVKVRRVAVPPLSGTLIGLGGFALGAATLAQGGLEFSVLAFTELVLGLLAGRALVRTQPAHDSQALGLSVLLVLAASVLNVKLSFFPLFVVFAIAAVWALATRQLLAGAVSTHADEAQARARTDVVTPSFFAGTGAVALAVLLTAGLLFVAFPRVAVGDLGGFVKRTEKLPSSVGLRGDPRTLGGTTVIARVEGVDRERWERGLYLRGVVYDIVNLDGFSQSERRVVSRHTKLWLADEEPRNERYTVTASPAVGDHVLLLGSVRIARSLAGGSMSQTTIVPIVGRTNHDELRTGAVLDGPLRYDVLGGIAHAGAPERAPKDPVADLDKADPQVARYLALPTGFGDELSSLAATVAGTGPLDEQVGRLRTFLLTQFAYGLDPPRFADQPLRAFLLEDRRGHCEFFAAAFALLLRSRGIASRVVGGYQGGAWDDGTIVFQERHAHAWVEWFLPGVGWVVDDATPMPNAPREELAGIDTFVERVRRLWDDKVIDFSFEDQLTALTRARQVSRSLSLKDGLVVMAGVLAVAAFVLLWRARRGRRSRVDGAPLGRAIASCVERATHKPVRASSTLREAVAAVPVSHPAREPLVTALDVYERARFAEEAIPPALLEAHARALRRAANRRQSAR